MFARSELQDEEAVMALKAIVMYCSATKTLSADAVPKKGIDPEGYVVEQIKQDVIWLGHPSVVIRGDKEPPWFR